MIKIFGCVLAMLMIGALCYSDPDTNTQNYQKNFRLMFKAGEGAVTGGAVADIKNALRPIPDSMSFLLAGGEADWFFLDNFGIMAGYEFNGIFVNKSGYNSLSIADISKIYIGPAYRIPLYSNSRIGFDFKVGAGLNYNFFDFTSDFKSLFPPNFVFFTGPATGPGFFAGGSFEFTFKIMIVSIGIYFNYDSYKFPEASAAFDMTDIEIPFMVGFAF